MYTFLCAGAIDRAENVCRSVLDFCEKGAKKPTYLRFFALTDIMVVQKRAAFGRKAEGEHSLRLRYKTVLFDFDGTICASGEGIMHCAALALQEMGVPVPPRETLRRFIGPPAEDCYQNFCGMTPEQAVEAVRRFRVHYDSTGWLKTEMYPGVPELLRDLRAAGAVVCTASSKPFMMVERLLQHFGVEQLFSQLCAADNDGGNAAKAQVIRKAMALCGTNSLTDTVMIGDTHYDAEGAAEVGLPFVGAAYGYGGKEDLKAGGAVCFADSPADLRRYLFIKEPS